MASLAMKKLGYAPTEYYCSQDSFEVSKVWPNGIGHVDKNVRVSETADLKRDDVVRSFEQRAAAIMGWRNNSTKIERVEVQRYDYNGYYSYRYDWDSLSTRGNRMLTFMVYLGDDCTGGGTNFPRGSRPGNQTWCDIIVCDADEDDDYSGVTFKPIAGSAVCWENFHPNGMPHRGTLPRIMPAAEVASTMEQILNEQVEVYNHVANTVHLSDACFENVIKPLIIVENKIQGQIAVIAMLRYASPDRAAREASDEAIMRMRESGSEITTRKDIYILVKAVKDKAKMLNFEDAKYLDSLMKEFTRSGHGRLNEDQIRTYLDRRNQIDDLRRQYNRNARNDDTGMWLSLDELDGVPAQDLARFSQGKDSDECDRKDMRFVRFTRADVNAVLQYSKNSATRKKIYVANEKKLPQNVDLFKQILLLRDENARLLGYASHAAFRLETRVAKSTDWVDSFLEELEQFLIPQGKREMQVLLDKRNLDLLESGNSMPPWDYDYYNRLVLEDLDVKHNQIAEYFPLLKTVSAMLEVFASCLQLQFTLLDPELVANSIWHSDVQVWTVWDAREAFKGSFVGYLYTDLLSRPNKHQGSQNVNLQCGYLKEDGTRVYPATILMCSFPRPTASSCALLKHSEMTSLFHELGHGMHDLISRTSSVRFHGHRMPPDFFEVPSVMLENWCWTKNELRQMSCHYTKVSPEFMAEWHRENPGRDSPPEKLPDELLDPLVKSRSVSRALWFLRQLAFARFDMAVHNVSTHEKCLNLDPGAVFNDFMERLRLLPNPNRGDRGHPQADFHHLVSGMDAGYYSYLCAAVFAADIYQNTFVEEPRSQTAWEKYRRGILEYGGSRDEMEMLEEFLGHRPSSEYLLRSL